MLLPVSPYASMVHAFFIWVISPVYLQQEQNNTQDFEVLIQYSMVTYALTYASMSYQWFYSKISDVNMAVESV